MARKDLCPECGGTVDECPNCGGKKFEREFHPAEHNIEVFCTKCGFVLFG